MATKQKSNEKNVELTLDRDNDGDIVATREEAIAEGMDARVLPNSDEEIRKANIQKTGRLQEDRNKRR